MEEARRRIREHALPVRDLICQSIDAEATPSKIVSSR